MATRFGDLTEFLGEISGEPIELPIRGKVYSFPATVPLTTGLKLRRIRALIDSGDKDQIAIDDEAAFWSELIGTERMAELEADGVTYQEFTHLGMTLMAFYTYGAAVGEMTWTGQLGKAPGLGGNKPAANRATRRTATKTSSPSGSTRRRSPQANSSRGGTRSTKSSGS